MAMTSTFTDQLSLGERLARARKATGLGQRDFSRVVGISTRSVSAYELDDRAPSFETVVRWAAATGAPVDYFADAVNVSQLACYPPVTEPRRDLEPRWVDNPHPAPVIDLTARTALAV